MGKGKKEGKKSDKKDAMISDTPEVSTHAPVLPSSADGEMNRQRDLLNQFWDLASDDASHRTLATVNILQYLHTYSAEGRAIGNDAQRNDVVYSLQRLVKGLSSSRDSARLGFGACLAELLSVKLPFASLSDCTKLIDQHTKVRSTRSPI